MAQYKVLSIRRLQRVTTSAKVIPEIDGLRFLAITSVVLFHLRTHLIRTTPFDLSYDGFWQIIYDLISNGGFGVNIFFGISGFILAIPFANNYLKGTKPVNLKAYYVRRLTRLEPPYFIIMTILLLVIIFYAGQPFSKLLPHYLASLGYSHFFIYGEWSSINPVAWSLETEIQFYLLAPLLFMIFKIGRNHLRRGIIVIIIASFIIMQFILFDWYIALHLSKSLLVYLPYFTIGVLFADYYLNHLANNKVNKNYFWDVIGLLSTFALFRYNPNNGTVVSVILLASLLLVFISTFKGRLLNHFYTRPFIYITGGMCYTIYLIHYAFIAFVMGYTSKIGFDGSLIVNLILQTLIILPLLFVTSSIFFLLFEKPFMYKDWPNKLKYYFNAMFNSPEAKKIEE